MVTLKTVGLNNRLSSTHPDCRRWATVVPLCCAKREFESVLKNKNPLYEVEVVDPLRPKSKKPSLLTAFL